MRILPENRFRKRAFLVFLVLFAVSCIQPAYLHDFILQHMLTVLSLAILIGTDRSLCFSRLSYTCILLFLTLHLLGARYLYSFVPYDDWSTQILGHSISDAFGFRRNHYDRFVHFAYGFLMTIPIREMLLKHLKLTSFWAGLFAVGFIVSTGALYEIAEWTLAMVMSPETADLYNGQQGDVWDPQRDMSLALVGALLISLVASRINTEV